MAPCQAQVSGENKHGVRQRQLTQDLYLHIYIASYISLSFPPLALDSCIQDYQLYRLCAPSRRSAPRLTESVIGGIGYYKYYSLLTIVYNYLQPFATTCSHLQLFIKTICKVYNSIVLLGQHSVARPTLCNVVLLGQHCVARPTLCCQANSTLYFQVYKSLQSTTKCYTLL